MSRTISSLPIRAISSRNQQSLLWTCRRCLATQAESTTNQPEFSPSLPSSQRRNADGKIVPLQRRDWLLKKPLPHAIPGKRLAHTTTDLLPPQEKAQRDSVPKQKRTVGVVISAGLMDRTVTVRLPGQVWNNHIKKWFRKDTKHLVHDPNNSLVTGDVIELHAEQHTKHVAYVVGAIVSPFGKPIEERPPVPTADDRLAAYKEKRFAKYKRRAERAVQVPKLRAAADAGDKFARIKLDQILAMQSGIPQKRDPASTGTKSKTAA